MSMSFIVEDLSLPSRIRMLPSHIRIRIWFIRHVGLHRDRIHCGRKVHTINIQILNKNIEKYNSVVNSKN